MKTILTIAGWAVATCALALAFILPVGLNATSPAEELAAKIAKPKLIVNGCELSLRAVGLTDTTTTLPSLELVATNPGKVEASVPWNVTLMGSQPVISVSRSAPMPTPVRSPGLDEHGIIALKPGETKVIALNKSAPTTDPIEAEFVIGADTNWPNSAVQQQAPNRAILSLPFTYTLVLSSGSQTIEPISFALPGNAAASAGLLNGVTNLTVATGGTLGNSVSIPSNQTIVLGANGLPVTVSVNNGTLTGSGITLGNASGNTVSPNGTLVLTGNVMPSGMNPATINVGTVTIQQKANPN